MSDDDLLDLMLKSAPMLPTQEEASSCFNRARILDAPAIFDKLMKQDGVQQHLDIVRMATDDMDCDEILDVVLEFIIYKYPGVIKEIKRDPADERLLMDVLVLCIKELKNVRS